METFQIIKAFREKGFLIEPKLLEFLLNNKDRINFILSQIEEKKPFQKILTLEYVNSILPKEEIEVKILKQPKKIEEISIENILQILNERYQKISNLLSKRIELTNLTSINKISDKLKKFSIIGIIREKDCTKNSIVIEDLTGEIELKSEELNFLVEDEIVGIVCERIGEEFHGKKIIFPDIPIYRELKTSKSDIRAIFVCYKYLEKLGEKFEKFVSYFNEKPTVMFCFDAKEELTEKFPLVYSFSAGKKVEDPCLIEINGIKIFFSNGNFLESYEKDFNVGRIETLIQLIKKRHLNPKISANLEEIFYLDPIPDIIAVKGNETGFKNYKGITIISCFSDSFISVDLKTRNVSKIGF